MLSSSDLGGFAIIGTVGKRMQKKGGRKIQKNLGWKFFFWLKNHLKKEKEKLTKKIKNIHKNLTKQIYTLHRTNTHVTITNQEKHIIVKKLPKYTLPNIYIYISSSSSYRAGSTDIPDPLSPLLPIVHRPR